MKNTRVLLRLVASTLATAGIVLGVATASVAAPTTTVTSRDSGWAHDSGWVQTAAKDSGW